MCCRKGGENKAGTFAGFRVHQITLYEGEGPLAHPFYISGPAGPSGKQSKGCKGPHSRPAAEIGEAQRLALNQEPGIPDPIEDDLEEIEAAELAEWEEQMEPVIGPLRELVERAESFEEIEAAPPRLLPQMDTGRLTLALARAFFKARALGDGGGAA